MSGEMSGDMVALRETLVAKSASSARSEHVMHAATERPHAALIDHLLYRCCTDKLSSIPLLQLIRHDLMDDGPWETSA